MLAAMAATSSHDKRSQEKQRRQDQQSSMFGDHFDWPMPSSAGGDDSLFAPPQRVRHEDSCALRIKKMFGNISPAPNHPQDSPRPMLLGGLGSLPAPVQPIPDTTGRHHRKTSESSTAETKQKHKKKKKESSEDKPKKSKSHRRERSSSKDSIASSTHHSSSRPSLPIPGDRHRSPSVCSDKSDVSSRSNRSSSKSGRSSKSNKTKQSSTSSVGNPVTNSSHTNHVHIAPSNTTPSSYSKNHTTSSASVPSNQKIPATSDGSSVAASSFGDTLPFGSLNNTSNSKDNTKSSSSSSRSGASTKKKPPELTLNGKAKTKPCNLVMPTLNKVDNDVRKILEIMTSAPDAITAIQTPCKPVKTPFSYSQPLQPIPDEPPVNVKNKASTQTPTQNNDTSKQTPKSAVAVADQQPSPEKSAKKKNAANGEIDELGLGISSDSDSNSSSSSSSSSSSDSSGSSSSSSDSDSSDDEAEAKKNKDVPLPIFRNLERSPVPTKPQTDAPNSWDLTNYLLDQSSKTVASKSSSSSHNNSTATNSSSKTSVTSISSKSASNAASGQTGEKRGRGRPRKEERKNPDPDFEPAKIQPTSVPSSHVRPVRKGKGEPGKRGRKKKDEISRAHLSSISSEDESSNLTSTSSPTSSHAANTLTISTSTLNSKRLPSVSTTTWNRSTGVTSAPVAPIAMEEDEIDVDVVSGESPQYDMQTSSNIPQPTSLANNLTSEPISPVEIKPPAVKSPVPQLLVSIPLHKLKRKPGVKKEEVKHTPSHVSHPLLSIKEEKASPKRKPTGKDLVLGKNKKMKTEEKLDDEDDLISPVSNPDISSNIMSKPAVPEMPVAWIDDPEKSYERARDLKKQSAATDFRPLRNLIALECVLNFMLSGLNREIKDPKIDSYYVATLALADNLFPDVFKDHPMGEQSLWIQKCCRVLSTYVSAHLSLKLYKLHKDNASMAQRRIEEHLKDARRAISPLNHPPGLPGTGINSRSRGSPISPAPSPASITSTGSLRSDSDRGAGSSASISVPDPILKDLDHYMKSMKYINSSYESWHLASFLKAQSEFGVAEFFQRIQDDLGYTIDMHTESKKFIIFIYTGLKRLKDKLTNLNTHQS